MEILKGVYRYFVNGDACVTEPWVIIQQDEDYWHIHVDRIADGGMHLALRAEIAPQRQRFAFTLLQETGAAPFARADYQIDDQGIRFRRNDDNEWQAVDGGSALFFPLMRLWTGLLVSKILDNGGQASVLVPSIQNPADREQLFAPLRSLRKAWPVPDTPSIFRYEGGEYAEAIALEIDAHHMMHHYEWQPADGPKWACQLEIENAVPDWQQKWARLAELMIQQ